MVIAMEQALAPAAFRQTQLLSTPSDSVLSSLNDLLHARAEIFASPSTSHITGGGKDIYQATLKATKYLFDNSLKAEPQSLKALAKLLADIRDSSYQPDDIETRSKAAAHQRQNGGHDIKGKGKAPSPWLSHPVFQQTPLDELYIGDDDRIASTSTSTTLPSTSTSSSSSIKASYADSIVPLQSNTDAELELQMLWEQLEYRNTKVLDIVREIINDGDESDGEDEEGLEEDDEDDSFDEEDEDEMGLEDDEDMLEGEEEGDSDEEEYDEDNEDLFEGSDSLDDDEDLEGGEDELPSDDLEERSAKKAPTAPYFAQLRDTSGGSSPVKSEPKSRKKGKMGEKEASEPATAKPDSALDDGLFSLKDFNSQVLAGEDEMRRYMQSGKSKSINDLRQGIDGLEDMDDSDNEEIDYFAPAEGDMDLGIGEDDDDEDDEEEEEEEEDGTRPEDMRYSDFWAAPAKTYVREGKAGARDQQQGKGKGKGGKYNDKGKDSRSKGKGKEAQGDAKPVSADQDQAKSDGDDKTKPKRKVSFHDQVKVQEFESTGQQSAFAALVKAIGMKAALNKLKDGEFVEEGEDDNAAGEESDDDDDDQAEEDDLDYDNMTEEEMQAYLEQDLNEEDDDEEEEEDEDMSEAGDEEGARTMQRLQKDLLAEEGDDDDDDSSAVVKRKKGSQSRYEARMQALSEQITALEQENVAEREWTMRGEVNARARPQNSLLEENLEFEQAAKVVPVVTEESSQSLEDRIKQRIIDDNFDDVVRKSITEAAAYIPSRLLDIKDTQNERSLADIYADEFAAERRRAAGEEAETPEIDTKLAKEHESIRTIFDDICGKLDALSNAHFTPQVAQTTITTLSNAPSISFESAMPSAMSAASALAPEEVYAPEQRGTLTAKSEMTPSQKKAARAKARKSRMQTQKVFDKYGGKSRNNKQSKERAMNSLIGKRGVTVVGKGKAAKSALTGGERRTRGEGPDTTGMSGAKFKL